MRPRGAPVVVAAIVIAFFAANFRWLDDNGFFARPPVNDSSWYRVASYRSSQVFQHEGLWAWVKRARRSGGSHPPFLVMFTGLALGVSGRPDAEPRDLFFVSAFFGALMTIGAWRLARNFLPPWPAVLCAFIVTACPGIQCWWRPLDPQLPMSAFVIWSLDAIVRSRGFTRFGHSALAGFWFALALQSKMLAPLYVAGPIVVALIAGFVGADRRRVWGGALIAGLCALPGILFWYPRHYRSVLAYTTYVIGDAGQGVYSSGVGPSAAARWLYYPRTIINEGFGFWVGGLVVPAVVVMTVHTVRRFRARTSLASFDARGIILAASPLAAYVPLTLGQTSSGSLYVIPFVPLGVLALSCALALVKPKAVRVALRVVAACAALAVAWSALRPLYADKPGPSLWGLVVNDRTDSRLGDPARALGVLARPEGERWPAVEFIQEMFRRNGGPVRYGFAELADQPLMTAAVVDYEAEKGGILVHLTSFLPSTIPRTPLDWARCRGADFFTLSSLHASLGQHRTVPELVKAIRETGVEVEVVLRRDPTPLSDLSLVEVVWPRTDTAVPVGRDALSDPRVQALHARFAGGAVLRGARGKVLGDGSLVVTTIWDLERAAVDDAVVGIALDLPGQEGVEWRRSLAVADRDLERPLVAVTSGDLRLPKDAAARIVVRLYAAGRGEDGTTPLTPEDGGDPSKKGVVVAFLR